ncbi:MAG: chromosomal replication initiator protein DnaA [Planctomycetaceae bacterium]|nr:chromosomal replication initiator protein DnaA [Planctomycetaceae bacterium]
MPPARTFADEGNSILDDLRRQLEERLGARRFQNWFGQKTHLEVAGSELVVHVQSPYLVKWIQRQFGALLTQLTQQVLGAAYTIRYEIGSEVVMTPLPEGAEDAPVQPSLSRKTVVTPEHGPSTPRPHRKTRRTYSLTDFVVGEGTALAMAAALGVVENPARVSPVYLHGSVGNGKTHLLEGIRGRLRKEAPDLQSVLLTAEQFANYYTQALDARSLPSFRSRFRNVDVLLVDDIDFFDGKSRFQEEFLHTVKQFEEQGRQVVVTANRHPRLLSKTSEELVTRYLSGVVCRLESPDEPSRREIVARHAKKQKCSMTPETLDHVAKRFTANVRELEGAVNLLGTWGQMTRQTVTLSVARKLLARLERDCLRIVQLSDVEGAVCEFFGVDVEGLRSPSRKRILAQPRMMAMYLSRRLTGTSYSEIGKHFGNRNHATVMSAERKVAKGIQADETIQIAAEKWSMAEIIETLEQRIKAG